MNLAQETLKHRLDDIPEAMRSHIRMGFHLLSRPSEEQRTAFLEYLLEITEKGESLDRDKAITLIGLDRATITDVLSAIAMVIGSTVDIDVTVTDLVEFGSGTVFDEADRDVVELVAGEVIQRRPSLTVRMKDAALANSVLPSFQALHTEVDLRIRFDNNAVTPKGGVPVAVCNLKTDCTDDMWFQVSISDIEELLKRLQMTLQQLKVVEQIALKIGDQ